MSEKKPKKWRFQRIQMKKSKKFSMYMKAFFCQNQINMNLIKNSTKINKKGEI